MDATTFAYWLHGLFELSTPQADPTRVGFTPEQAAVIKEHLELVFHKTTRITTSSPLSHLTTGCGTQGKEPTFCVSVGDGGRLCANSDASPMAVNQPATFTTNGPIKLWTNLVSGADRFVFNWPQNSPMVRFSSSDYSFT